MAKKSKIVRNEQRREVVARYADLRAELKRIIAAPASTGAERAEAQRRLHALPRDASPTRLRNRDAVDGRPRGYIGKAGLSRVRFRELAHRGELPGIHKSSW
ncbi:MULTISPECIES: 30S ribosomal protein S14 [Gordonia]|uniref:Small ribosomal subunit protein uS14 n=1 Tax=Gordonia amicalis TaxID=89053 RepID=A0ABU4DH76_9ACTN|nr:MULTISPECIES: 30S ribosomal protein S14 [Gordonia]ATD68941.1 30S ribosomal protein S14 [Gordonia sp. 1D]MBA5846562.1 30S ribosomal protein S14 [Gordonia amicalis]MDV6309097.1 30S ribosomal protein S14 [Gordonia amicalis]MDV7101012.1 30S ribosomal protein S14 [Gordonia amicalis]MDV7173220.1 30S ribosomal protein S14 [Gordonia amicalis]